ncbi:MAG: integrin alpha [Planctomycetota bacterium]
MNRTTSRRTARCACTRVQSAQLLYTLDGQNGSALFGVAVAPLGDVDGDGRNDFVVGAPLADDAGLDFGTSYVFSGPTGTLVFKQSGAATGDGMGWSVGGAGDVNGDARNEVILSVPGDDTLGLDAGKVLVVTARNCPASWSSYGAGWPGTLGVPSLSSSDDPVLCSSITLQIDNARGAATVGALFIGAGQAAFATPLGGTLLVAPPWLILLVTLPEGGLSLPVDVICDSSYCGLEIDLQCLEVDPGATRGVSFTPGLSLVLGG